ncbi:hypothetical protein AOA80_10500 [Methanomassiliicoccales archaeon RumEn M1]|jgi:hypothetical protein|nr:hypothetical protein AOA80_10500 [Methanomassiliicoccales archaeon RumEn M1]
MSSRAGELRAQMLSRWKKRAISRSARSRFLKDDREGVASTIGTIMALLVFLSLMALITNSYVPAWMMDNEREHMNQVIDQFGGLKGKVDGMMVQWTIRGSPSGPMYAPISLGSSGVPLFASPTIGILRTVPGSSSTSAIHMEFGAQTIDGGGKAELYCPNRYYVQQWLAYENGAIIMKQEDGQTLLAYPGLSISRAGGVVDIQFTQVDLVGQGMTISGSHSIGLNVEMYYAGTQTFNVNGDWVLTLNTEYGQAWEAYLKDMFERQGMMEGNDYTFDSDLNAQTGVTEITLIVSSVNTLTLDQATVSMTTVDS